MCPRRPAASAWPRSRCNTGRGRIPTAPCWPTTAPVDFASAPPAVRYSVANVRVAGVASRPSRVRGASALSQLREASAARAARHLYAPVQRDREVPYPVPTGSRLSGPRVNIPGLGSYFPLYADRSGYWAIEYYVNGRPRREPVGRILRKPPAQTTEAEAKRCLTARRRQQLAGSLPPGGPARLPSAKLVARYLAERISEGIKKPNYVRLNSRPILDAVGHLLAANLQTQHCTDWILAMREKGWSNATISTNLGYLRAAYRYGCQRAPPQLVAAMPYIPAGGRARRRTG